MSLMLSILITLGSPFLSHAAPEARLFGQLPQAHDAAISPDGSKIALLQNYKGQYLVNFVNIDSTEKSGKARIVALGDKVKPVFIKWIDNKRVIVSVRQFQLYRKVPINAGFLHLIDSETLKANLVVRPARRGLRQFNNEVLDWLEDDPDHIVMQYADDGKDQTLPDVRKVRVDSGRSKTLARSVKGVNQWVTDANGIPRVGIGYRKEGFDPFMRILDPVSEKWRRSDHFPGIDPETMRVIAVINDGKTLILSAYRGKDKRGLHQYDLVEKEWGKTLYENDQYDVSSIILSKDGNEIVGASFTGESTERVLFDDYKSTFEEALAYFDEFEVQFVDQSDDSETLLIRVTSPSDPGGLFLFKRGGEAALILSNLSELTSAEMGIVVSIEYSARDGQKIPAFITLPPMITDSADLKSIPAIILPHGGPYARDAKRFDWLAQFFATRGYLVLQMNFRGSEGYGKTFADAGRNSWVVMQEDVEDGMRWLVNKGYADPDKSCIAGWSYGGYAALMGAVKTPDLYQCSIAIAALSDIPGAIKDARDYVNGKARAERTFGVLMDDKDLMRANNPVQQADKIQVPVFLAHGEVDSAVQFGQYKKMKRSLDKAGVDGTYMEFENEDHYMSNQENRQALLKGIEQFLLTVNGPSPFMMPDN